MKNHPLLKPLFAIWLLLISLLVAALPAQAQDTNPDELMKSLTGDVMATLRKNPDKLNELIDARILPHFDFDHMTRLAVAKDWNKANPQQRQALVSEFRTLLVRTYSNALFAYRNQTISYKPGSTRPDGTVVVKMEVRQPGGQIVPINCELEKAGSTWKVFDVVVDGISLVTNYRETFAQEVRNGGIDGLIASLVAKNKAPLPAKK